MGLPDNFSLVREAAQTATADFALITDSNLSIVYVSPSFTAMTGYTQGDLEGKNCRVLQGVGTDPNTRMHIRDLLTSGGIFDGKILNYRKDGSPFWTSLRITPLRVGSTTTVTHFVSVQRDISNDVALLTQLQDLARHDPVTGLPNRPAAERALEIVVKRSLDLEVTAAVGLIDLDDFRHVNNALGHAAGDTVLRQWSTRVLSHLCDGDILARMGGDEFIVILKNLSRAGANEELSARFERIHRAISEPFTVGQQQIFLEMKMGIALVPQDGTDSWSILRSADEALHVAKARKGQGGAWWETATPDSIDLLNEGNATDTSTNSDSDDLVRSQEYRAALQNGDVVVHFQPVVNLREGSVHLFEALARLNLSGGRVVYPGEFLPYFGTEDLRALFVDVLDQALGTLARWDRDGIHHKVSVNLPPAVLLDGTVPALVNKMLEHYEIEPGRLGLELLESEVISLEQQRTTLRELLKIGIGLAMDDLGAGYSSLQRVSSFPFSAIKLDRGLFDNVKERPVETLSVIATLIQLGRDLNMHVAVEGLENESLTEAAFILGGFLGQGYYLSKPIPIQDCLKWSDSFDLGAHLSPIRTPLGALAYHLQFSRLVGPHIFTLESCPLTNFIQGAGASEEIIKWHSHYHENSDPKGGPSQLFIDWLTPLIRARD